MLVKCIKSIDCVFVKDYIYFVDIEDSYLYYIDTFWVKKSNFVGISSIREDKLKKLGII